MRPTVGEILSDHVSLEVSCLDRVYVNGYVPSLQTSGQLVYFLSEHLGNPLASPALLGRIGERFRRDVKRFVEQHRIAVVRFQRGERKDEIAKGRRQRFQGKEGVVFVGVAQERCRSFKATRGSTSSGGLCLDFN